MYQFLRGLLTSSSDYEFVNFSFNFISFGLCILKLYCEIPWGSFQFACKLFLQYLRSFLYLLMIFALNFILLEIKFLALPSLKHLKP